MGNCIALNQRLRLAMQNVVRIYSIHPLVRIALLYIDRRLSVTFHPWE